MRKYVCPNCKSDIDLYDEQKPIIKCNDCGRYYKNPYYKEINKIVENNEIVANEKRYDSLHLENSKNDIEYNNKFVSDKSNSVDGIKDIITNFEFNKKNILIIICVLMLLITFILSIIVTVSLSSYIDQEIAINRLRREGYLIKEINQSDDSFKVIERNDNGIVESASEEITIKIMITAVQSKYKDSAPNTCEAYIFYKHKDAKIYYNHLKKIIEENKKKYQVYKNSKTSMIGKTVYLYE